VKVILVETIRIRTDHDAEPLATVPVHAAQKGLFVAGAAPAAGDLHRAAVTERECSNVDRIGAGVFGEGRA
jgi:hypothetical protein